MTPITKAQRHALFRIYSRLSSPPPYKTFRKTVQPTFFCDGAITVPAAILLAGLTFWFVTP